jgi:hypothetical protein
MYDSLGAKGIRSALARRDQVMNGDNNLTSDRISLVFDTFRDKNSRTWFELNPDGVKGDHQNGDASYDPVWEGATRIDSLGWTAEFRIPYSQLRFPRDSTVPRPPDQGLPDQGHLLDRAVVEVLV